MNENKFKPGMQVTGHLKGEPLAGSVWTIDGDEMVVAFTRVVGGKLSYQSKRVKTIDFRKVS